MISNSFTPIVSILALSLINSSCAALSLLNSATTHVKYTVSDTKFDDVHYENTEQLGDVSFSIRNIQHPQAYNNWETNIKLRPSVHYDKERYEVNRDQDFSSFSVDPDDFPLIQIRRLLTFGNLKATAHTPVGAFVLTGGLGVSLAERRDDGDYVHTQTSKISKVDLVWIGFLSKRFYLMMGPRYYKEGYEQFVFALRLGYFWSDPESS